jgi:cbb3-type cytochrome oxidase subunit 3
MINNFINYWIFFAVILLLILVTFLYHRKKANKQDQADHIVLEEQLSGVLEALRLSITQSHSKQ